MIVLVIIAGIVCGLTVAMILTSRKNTKERNKRVIKSWKEQQRYKRLMIWREKAIDWKIEQKKPVKVKFD